MGTVHIQVACQLVILLDIYDGEIHVRRLL